METRITSKAIVLVAILGATAFGRKWTDVSGQFSTEATFVELKDGSVILEKTDGLKIIVPLGKLSTADREFIGKLQKSDEVKRVDLTLTREGNASFIIDGDNNTLSPFVAFAFYSETPTPQQMEAGMKYMKTRFETLSKTKAPVGNDKENKMSGLEIMQFVASFAAQNGNTSLRISPFHGAGNKSGHYGLTGDFFQIKQHKVAFVVLFCKEINEESTKHQFEFDRIGLKAQVLDAIRSAKGIAILTCDRKGQLGPSGQLVEK